MHMQAVCPCERFVHAGGCGHTHRFMYVLSKNAPSKIVPSGIQLP